MERFTSMARILSHLGEQLISSSSVALLELIKNSYDAGSPSVNIIIDQAKRTIIVEDKGHGMSKDSLIKNYLVVGTTDRLKEKDQLKQASTEERLTQDVYAPRTSNRNRVPLGEKGLGRFATMKLGGKLVLLTKSTESQANLLLVNWNHFDYSSERRLEDINVHLSTVDITKSQNDYSNSFTKIKIYDLKDFCDPVVWDKKEFEKFYRTNFSKYLNPFQPQKGFQIKLEIFSYFGDYYKFYPEDMDRKFLTQAPYQIRGTFSQNKFTASYYMRNDDGREKEGKLEDIVIQTLDRKELSGTGEIGNFDFEIYFFNRRGDRLKEIKGYENIKKIRDLLNQYAGGVMIYRDNFRVLPYAAPGNDWLELDRDKWSHKGVRFNTIQTVGAIHITSLANPNLKDQTNREGLINNTAYQNLQTVLKFIIDTMKITVSSHFPKVKTDENVLTADEISESINPFGKVLQNISNSAEEIRNKLDKYTIYDNELINSAKELVSEVDNLSSDFEKVRFSVIELNKKIKEVEEQQRLILDLAGIGMTAETAAHEMRSYLDRINVFLKQFSKRNPHEKFEITNLLQNTKSLETVVSRLEVQSVTKRRTKTKLNLNNVIGGICKSKLRVWEMNETNPVDIEMISNQDSTVKANEGMIIQIFDNLLNNSHYWLLKHLNNVPNAKPIITINIGDGVIEFSDNGFGIPEVDAKFIFDPFFTRRKEGRGLGLYIVQEMLNYHEATVELDQEKNNYGNYFKFIIDLTKTLC